MKLYAKVSSDRADKGQGGNDHIDIDLFAFDRESPISTLRLSVLKDAVGKEDMYLLTYEELERGEGVEPVILNEGHREEGQVQSIYDLVGIGEKQKGKDVLKCDWCKTRPATHKDWREIDETTTSTRECDECSIIGTYELLKKYDK